MTMAAHIFNLRNRLRLVVVTAGAQDVEQHGVFFFFFRSSTINNTWLGWDHRQNGWWNHKTSLTTYTNPGLKIESSPLWLVNRLISQFLLVKYYGIALFSLLNQVNHVQSTTLVGRCVLFAWQNLELFMLEAIPRCVPCQTMSALS